MIAQLILLGILQTTSYRPVPEQTKPECRGRFECTTSIDDGITMFGCAISQDILKSGRAHYGDVVYIEGYGYHIINDTMNVRVHNAVDIMVFTKSEEKRIGVRHCRVFVLSQPIILPGGSSWNGNHNQK